MLGNGLLRERAERETQDLVLAVLLRPQTTLLQKESALGFGTIPHIVEFTRKLKLDELHNSRMIRKTIAEILEERITTLALEIQTNLRKLLENVLERVLLRDDALRVEGVHIGHLELVRQRLHQELLGNTLDTNTDLLIGREIGEVLGRTIRNPLLQRLTKVGCPGPHRELRNHILVLLLAEEPAQATILAHRALEATHPWLKRRTLKRRDISTEPLADRRLENLRIGRRHECRVTRTNAASTIHEEHRQNRSLELGLHRRAVIIAILENPEVFDWNKLLDLGLEIGVDVTGTRRVLATLETRAELSLRNKPRQIVAAHEVLRHADDRLVKRRLAVMIAGVLTDLACELGHANLRREIALEGGLQNLALRRLESVHH